MTQRERRWLAVLLAAAILRLLILPAYALHDTTEARYAEIGRRMAVSGDWVTPRLAPDEPFWGKPPLSFWLTAASISAIGSNELAARLPAFVTTLLTAALVFGFGRRTGNRETGLVAATILLTSALGFVLAGAVMTDSTLVLTTTLAMAAFWYAAVNDRRRWRYPFFVAVALGLLAKGPIAAIMIGVPVLAWLALQRDSTAWRRMPWFTGSLLVVAIALPWYALAEARTPGFLDYYLLGEHWARFVHSGWQGDLYGSAHSRPRGTIWLFALAAALPWTLPAIRAAIGRCRRGWQAPNRLQTYLLAWMLTPLVFFTFAGNILPTYAATGLPAFSLLLAAALQAPRRDVAWMGWSVPLLVTAAVVALTLWPQPQKTQRDIVAYRQRHAPALPLYYFPARPHSADFYSQGQPAAALETDTAVEAFLSRPGPGLLAIRKRRLSGLRLPLADCTRVPVETLRYVLLEKLPAGCGPAAGASDAELEQEVMIDEQAGE